jgi:hypothetical protein
MPYPPEAAGCSDASRIRDCDAADRFGSRHARSNRSPTSRGILGSRRSPEPGARRLRGWLTAPLGLRPLNLKERACMSNAMEQGATAILGEAATKYLTRDQN